MLNQLVRYEPVLDIIDETPGAELLEVGSGSRGVAEFLSPRWRITACDLRFNDYGSPRPAPPSPRVTRVTGTVLDLPFRARAFDAVVAMDLLEHLRVENRLPALEELTRVTRRLLIVGAPSGAAAEAADRRLSSFYRRFLRASEPGWLREHVRNGFPEPALLEHALAPYGEIELVPNEWLPAHSLLVRLEAMPLVRRLPLACYRGLTAMVRLGGSRRRAVGRLVRVLRGFDRPPTYRTIAILRLPQA